jgi:chromosome segregation ATPase
MHDESKLKNRLLGVRLRLKDVAAALDLPYGTIGAQINGYTPLTDANREKIIALIAEQTKKPAGAALSCLESLIDERDSLNEELASIDTRDAEARATTTRADADSMDADREYQAAAVDGPASALKEADKKRADAADTVRECQATIKGLASRREKIKSRLTRISEEIKKENGRLAGIVADEKWTAVPVTARAFREAVVTWWNAVINHAHARDCWDSTSIYPSYGTDAQKTQYPFARLIEILNSPDFQNLIK